MRFNFVLFRNFLYPTCLLFLFSFLGRVLFEGSFSLFSLILLFITQFCLMAIFSVNRLIMIFLSVLLLFFVMGYVVIKLLGLIPPVDDTLALMFLTQTDWNEVKDFLSWQIILVLILALFLTYGLLYPILRRKNYIWTFPFKKRLKLSLISLFILLCLYPGVKNFLPFNLWQISLQFSWAQEYSSSIKLSNPQNAPLVVYFIGESLRGDHLSINGYKRDTTPLLKKLDIINFGLSKSCATYTKAAWRYLTQRSDCSTFVSKQENMVTLFKKLGYKTHFMALTDVEAEQELSINSDSTYPLTRDIYRIDIPFRNIPLDKKNLIILGHRGSHYNYKTYPITQPTFRPICTETNFYEMSKYCSKKEIRNDYDNTILQLDKSIYGIIQKLKQVSFPVIFLFTSDHGEMLGEKNIWAHGYSPKLKETHLIPLFFWVNEAYKNTWPEKYEALIKNREQFVNRISQDDLWYSVMDAIGTIQKTKEKILNRQRSLFSFFYKSKLSDYWYKPEYKRY